MEKKKKVSKKEQELQESLDYVEKGKQILEEMKVHFNDLTIQYNQKVVVFLAKLDELAEGFKALKDGNVDGTYKIMMEQLEVKEQLLKEKEDEVRREVARIESFNSNIDAIDKDFTEQNGIFKKRAARDFKLFLVTGVSIIVVLIIIAAKNLSEKNYFASILNLLCTAFLSFSLLGLYHTTKMIDKPKDSK